MLKLLQKSRHVIQLRNCFKTSKRNYADLHQNTNYKLCAVPALEDNYMYLLINRSTRLAIAVDPVDPTAIVSELEVQKATLNAVLTTHHHLDHCGGNEYLKEKFGIPIFGGDDRIQGLTDKIRDQNEIQLNSFNIKCLFTPCHTSGHMSFYIQSGSETPVCFSGDTLFVAGCGRFFEGTPGDMLHSLGKIARLPPHTLICCGHEYSVNNLKYAVHVEPDNVNACQKLQSCLVMRSQGKPTVPSTVGEELTYNPFLRVNEENVKRFTGQSEPAKVMAELRRLKDQFKI